MKVALFGGAFDPPHLGHSRVAREMVARGVVDEVWYIPVFEHPWAERLKKLKLAPYQTRKKMVEFILTPGTRLKEYKQVSWAYPTLLYFSKKHPEHDFSWVIGSEYLESFADWKLADKVLAEFGVYVYPRAGFPLKPLTKGMTALTGFPEMAVSSSQIREKVREGEDIKDLVEKSVLEYIRERRLY